MVIEIKTNTIIQNKTFLDSIFKLENKLNNRKLFLSEFKQELIELKRVSYHVKEILYVFYDPYYDKIKVIPSVLEFTLDIKNAIYVDKFKLEKFLTKNNNLISNPKDFLKRFNLAFPESKIENVILKLKFKCLNNETNSIDDFILSKQFNYEDVYPYYLNDKCIKLLLSIKCNCQDETRLLFSEIDFLNFNSEITSFLYLLKHLESTEIFYHSNIEIDFYNEYIKYLVFNNKRKLFTFLSIITPDECLLALRSLILLLKKNKEIFNKSNVNNINYYSYLYILRDNLILFKKVFVDKKNLITKDEFFEILEYIFNIKKDKKFLFMTFTDQGNKNKQKILNKIMNSK